ncbi:TonB-dependent receptor [Fulvivirgaceae bacterium BMA10]|uniref:TonB-dependent receptor n=1 Tax=Splendidivirga corallicola TaxID=3051826 RepID=A0ABT8KUC8_9BACT|nr:TonB-dependent receptor [Fulvivirgaceae bacterium BMA10]
MNFNYTKTIYNQLLLIVKGVLLQCIFISVVYAHVGSAQSVYQVKIDMKLQKASLIDIIDGIQEKTDYHFAYREQDILKETVRTTKNFRNESVGSILEFVAKKYDFHFKQINRTITAIKIERNENPSSESLKIVEEKIISGNVKDAETSQPLPGATVLIKGTDIGTTTDVEGQFSFSVPDNANQLVVSFVGYITEEIAIGDRADFDIKLLPDAKSLDEIVVIGYGSDSKEKVNGAMSEVKAETLEKYATGNFEQAILGTMAGVLVTQNGRNPGEDSRITIRGIKTLTAGINPLIVVDGIPLTEGSSLNSINPNDIESINVLKDAASSAIYGSRASNGVILITTKKGQTGKLQINFNAYTGVQSRTDKLELINAYDAAQFFKEARDNGYVSRDPANRSESHDNATRIANGANKRELTLEYTQPYLDGIQGLTDTDWMDAVFRDAQISNYYVSLSGGTPKTDYFLSIGYLDQEGIVIGSNIDRYSSNLRLNTDISEKLKFGINLNTSFSIADVLDDNGWNNLPPDPGSSFYLMYPFFKIRNDDGSFAISDQIEANTPEDGSLSENTVAMTLLTKNKENKFRTFGSAFLEYEILEGLKFKTSFGSDFRSYFYDYYQPSTFGRYRTHVDNNQSNSTETDIRIENILSENTLNYEKTMNDHKFNILAGYSYQQENFKRTEISATGIVDNNIDNIAAGSNHAIDSRRSKWTQISYFGRLQYDFKDKYLFSASLRRDGSSRFGDDSKWGTFSSFSGAWILSRESFFPSTSIITFTKLRASWGQTGNNQIGAYGSQALVTDDNYAVDGVLVPGFATTSSPNPDLSWETNTSSNFGLDLGFLDNRLMFTAEYYISNTDNLLLEVPVPQQSGFSFSLQNIGEVKNRGFELELNGRGFKYGDLTIGFHANLTTNDNEVIALGPDQDQIIASRGGSTYLTRIGGPIAEIYGWDIIGVYKSQEEIDNTPHMPGTLVGDYMVRDADGDGDVDDDDRVGLGTYNPDFTYTIGANLAFRGFDFSFSFTGVEGRKVYDHLTARGLEVGEGFTTASQYYFDNRYHPVNNPNGFFAQPNLGNFSSARRNTRMSSITVSDGDYLRLRSIQLGYSLPESMLNNIGLTKARVYLAANNLFTVTDFRGINTEGGIDDPLRQGYVRSTASIPRTVFGGINVTF